MVASTKNDQDGFGVAEVQLLRGAVEGRQPERDARPVVPADEERVAVRRPDRCVEAAVDRLRQVRSLALPGRRRDMDVAHVVRIAIAGTPIGQLRPVGREGGKALELRLPGDGPDRPGRDIEDADRALVVVAGVGRLEPDEREELPVGRPGERRGRRARRECRGKAPRAGRQALRFAPFGGDEPGVNGHRRLADEDVVVPDFEKVVPLLDLGLVRPLVFRRERDGLSVGPKREVLDSRRSVRDLLGFAAAHREDVDLRLRVLLRTSVREERETVA